jgi:hypothetical protein
MDYLDGQEKGIRHKYQEYVRDGTCYLEEDGKTLRGFPTSQAWVGSTDTYVCDILGPGAYKTPKNSNTPCDEGVFWFKAILTAKCDAASKARDRADGRISTIKKRLAGMLGEEFWKSPVVPSGFNTTQARKVLNELKLLQVQLGWLATTEADEEIQEEQIDREAADAADRIADRWSRLSPAAQMSEYSQMMVGWLIGLIEGKTGKKVEATGFSEGNDFLLG